MILSQKPRRSRVPETSEPDETDLDEGGIGHWEHAGGPRDLGVGHAQHLRSRMPPPHSPVHLPVWLKKIDIKVFEC